MSLQVSLCIVLYCREASGCKRTCLLRESQEPDNTVGGPPHTRVGNSGLHLVIVPFLALLSTLSVQSNLASDTQINVPALVDL